MIVVAVAVPFFSTFVGSGRSFEASSDTPGNPEMVHMWPEVFCRAMSAATCPAPSLSGTTRHVPEGISAVVHAEPPACDGAEDAGAVVELGGLELAPPTEDCAGAELDVPVPAPAAPSEPEEAAELGEEVALPTELALPGEDPALLFEELPEQPAVRATAPNAPAATRTEIRFMETHPSRVTTVGRRPVTRAGCH